MARLVRKGLSEEMTFKENPSAFKGKTKCEGPERRGESLEFWRTERRPVRRKPSEQGQFV